MFMLQIREDTKKGVYVENLKEVEVTSARDVIQQLTQVYNPFIICSFFFFLISIVYSNIVLSNIWRV